MLDKIKSVVIGILLLIASFIAGKYTTPEKIVTKIEEKVVVKEVVKWKKSESKEDNKNKETIIVETTYPDGTVKKETRIIDKGTVKISLNQERSKESESSKVVTIEKSTTNEKSNWQVSLLASTQNLSYNDISSGKTEINYGIHVQKRVLGPFYLGGFALDTKTFGLSVGGIF